jgi:protein phosphatase
MCIEIFCRTDTGRVREHNEDCVGADESLGLAVLADGMGGYQAGEVASEMAIKTVIKQLNTVIKTPPHKHHHANHNYHSATVLLEQAVLKANKIIHNMAEKRTDCRGMGTTLVAVLFHNDFISVAHVGDSRLYRLRGNTFCQMTKDHSVRQELVDCGYYTPEQARHSPNKNLVTRALGVGEKVTVDIQEYKLLAQDIYLLCSDGLNDMLEDCDMRTILNNANSFEEAAELLINAANEKGGNDNSSLILVRSSQGFMQKQQKVWWRRLFDFFSKGLTR